MGRHKVGCHCGSHLDEQEIREDGKGEQIAVVCTKCLRFVSQRCRVCRQDFRDLHQHHIRSKCGAFDKAGMWWMADRPPNAGSPPEPHQLELGGLT